MSCQVNTTADQLVHPLLAEPCFFKTAVAMTLNQLDADSRKLRGVLESLGPCSSVLAALRTLQLQGPRLSTSRVVFLNQRLTYMYAEVWFGCFKAQRLEMLYIGMWETQEESNGV